MRELPAAREHEAHWTADEQRSVAVWSDHDFSSPGHTGVLPHRDLGHTHVGQSGATFGHVSGSDPGVILVAHVHGLVGSEPELRTLLTELRDATRGEAKSTGFEVLADAEPGELVLLMSWRDEAALRDHYGSPHYLRYRDHVGPLLARPSDVVMHRIGATQHLRDPNPPEPGMFG